MKKTIVIVATSTTCSYSRALRDLLRDKTTGQPATFSAFAARFPGADFVWVDGSLSSVMSNSWVKNGKLSGALPIVAIFEGNTKLTSFVARRTTLSPWTADRVAIEIGNVCPSCVLGSEPPAEEEPSTPTCGGCSCKKCGTQIAFCPACGTKL